MSEEKQEPLTAEQVLEKYDSVFTPQLDFCYQYSDCVKAMHEFSDQQTKALMEQNHNLEVTCAVRHDTIQTNILIIDKLQSELTQVKEQLETTKKVMQSHIDEQDALIFEFKEHNKQLAEAIQNYLNASNKDAERDTKYNLKLTLDNHQKQTKP